MQLIYRFFLLALLLGVFLLQVQQVSAQALDTLVVEWEDPNSPGFPLQDNLRNVILSDTLPDGSHPQNRVYKLLRGGLYWNNNRIVNTGFHLRIVGEKGDPNDPIFGNPPVIQMVNDPQPFVDDKMIVGSGDLTMKNLYIIGCDDNGVQTYYQPIELSGEGKHYEFENVIFERTNFALVAFTNPGNYIYFRDCVFRNLLGRPSTQQWEGRGTSIWADQDTVVVENCTFLFVNMTPFQLEGGSGKYVRFNHNTIVNVGRSVNTGNWWQEAYFTNNLIVNGWWHGEGTEDLTNPNRDPRDRHGGLFTIGDLPSDYGPEEGRRIAIANNSYYLDPVFTNYYADTIQAAQFINPVTRLDYINVLDQVVVQDTIWANPQLATAFEPAQYDSMIQNIEDIRHGITPARDYMWMIPQLPPPDVGDCNICPSWPLPEDLTYTNTQLLAFGTDGLPLGDLNWFPTQKAMWEQNKAQHIKDIEDLPGERKVFEVKGDTEAEDGTLAGGATIGVFEGFTYIDMDGGGFFEWEFDMPSAMTVDLIVTTASNDAQRGQRIIINGQNIRNNTGFGEWYWDDLLPRPNWQSYLITKDSIITTTDGTSDPNAVDLMQGTNTLRVEPSWGWQEFVGFDVMEAGTTTPLHELRAPNLSNFSIVQLVGEDAIWTPSGFKYVALNGGSVSWPFTADEAGTYRLAVFYQVPDGSQFVQVSVDGNAVLPNQELPGVSGDSTGKDILTGNFQLSQGQHTISISGNNVNLDFVQFIQEVPITGLNGDDLKAEGFYLAQNYPNPFNPSTTIIYNIPQRSEVSLQVFNILGQKVRTLVKNQKQVAGRYIVEWDGKNEAGNSVATGVYIYRLKAGDFIKSHKMTLLK